MGDKIIFTIYIHRRVNRTISLFMLNSSTLLMKNELEVLFHNMVHIAEEFSYCIHHIGEYCNGISVLVISYAFKSFSNHLSIKHRLAHKNSKMRLFSLTLLVNQSKIFANMRE